MYLRTRLLSNNFLKAAKIKSTFRGFTLHKGAFSHSLLLIANTLLREVPTSFCKFYSEFD